MRCVLHVGPPKTGSSSIQAFLRENQDALSRDGIFIPRTRTASQREFNILAKSKPYGKRAGIRWGTMTVEGLAEQQDKIKAQLDEIFRGLDGHHTAVISVEGLGARELDEIEQLRDAISPYFDTFRIVYYLRRQDLVSVSQLKNWIKLKGVKEVNPFRKVRDSNADRLEGWATVFGEGSIAPTIFPDSSPQRTDLIESFLSAAEIDINLKKYVLPGRRNTNWDVRALELMRLINRHLPHIEDGKVPAARKIIEDVLAEGWEEFIGYRPAREAAEEYFSLPIHAEDNERVRARWFPDSPTLFNEDFSMYPETIEPRLTVEDCAYALAKVAVARSKMARSRNLLGESKLTSGKRTKKSKAKQNMKSNQSKAVSKKEARRNGENSSANRDSKASARRADQEASKT